MKNFESLYAAAKAAGSAAGAAAAPRPMTVASGEKSWYVPEGVCGFAWVTVRPATTPFARWLKKMGYARPAYGGGLCLWVSEFNQSYERKLAAATAMAEVLRAEGVSAYADGRLD